jgi:hypothetical protein
VWQLGVRFVQFYCNCERDIGELYGACDDSYSDGYCEHHGNVGHRQHEVGFDDDYDYGTSASERDSVRCCSGWIAAAVGLADYVVCGGHVRVRDWFDGAAECFERVGDGRNVQHDRNVVLSYARDTGVRGGDGWKRQWSFKQCGGADCGSG